MVTACRSSKSTLLIPGSGLGVYHEFSCPGLQPESTYVCSIFLRKIFVKIEVKNWKKHRPRRRRQGATGTGRSWAVKEKAIEGIRA
jgi:hypothetical protein